MTGTEIVRRERGEVQKLSPENLALVKRTIMPNASDSELALFAEIVNRTGLDPWLKQVHAIPIWDDRSKRYTFQFAVGINGLRLVAQRSGLYDGQEGPFWKAQGGDWQESWDSDEPPYAAKSVVHRKGSAHPFSAVVHFKDFARRNRQGALIGNWATMPAHMLAIRAESHSLRRAFPQETAGLKVRYDAGDEEAPREILNPEQPATVAQKQKLAILAQELGWDDTERRARAGVESFSDLKKGRAHELITEWQSLQEGEIEDAVIVEHPAEDEPGVGSSPPEQDPEAEGDPGRGPSDPDASAAVETAAVGDQAGSGSAPREGDPERAAVSTPVEAESEEGVSTGGRLPPGPSASTTRPARRGSRAGKAGSKGSGRPAAQAVEGDSAGVEPAESTTLDGPATDVQFERAQAVWNLPNRNAVLGRYVREFQPERSLSVDELTGRMLEALIAKKIGPRQETLDA